MLILKKMEERSGVIKTSLQELKRDGLPPRHRDTELGIGGDVTLLSRVFAYEWQGKDLRDTEYVRVANKGLTNGLFCASVQLRAMDLPQRHGEHREDFGVEEGTPPWRREVCGTH